MKKRLVIYILISIAMIIFAAYAISKGSDKWFLAVLVICAMILYEVSHRKTK